MTRQLTQAMTGLINAIRRGVICDMKFKICIWLRYTSLKTSRQEIHVSSRGQNDSQMRRIFHEQKSAWAHYVKGSMWNSRVKIFCIVFGILKLRVGITSLGFLEALKQEFTASLPLPSINPGRRVQPPTGLWFFAP
jgi:hypothetical protein